MYKIFLLTFVFCFILHIVVKASYILFFLQEFIGLKTLLHGYNVVRYEPTATVKEDIKDGGVAIIDQIICSHAR